MVEAAQSALTDAITVNALQANRSIFFSQDLLAASTALRTKATDVDANLHGLYLGFGSLGIGNQALFDYLGTVSVPLWHFAPNATVASPPLGNASLATPWDAVRLFARYSRRLSGIVVRRPGCPQRRSRTVLPGFLLCFAAGDLRQLSLQLLSSPHPGIRLPFSISASQNFDTRAFPFTVVGNATNIPTYLRFLQANGPTAIHDVLSAAQALEASFQLSVTEEVESLQMTVLIVVSCVAIVAAYVFRDLLAGVANARIRLLTVFLIVPRKVTIDLAAKPTQLPWLDGDTDEQQTKRAGEEEDRRVELEGVAREDDTKLQEEQEVRKSSAAGQDGLTGSKRGDVLAALLTWTRKRSTMDRRSDDDSALLKKPLTPQTAEEAAAAAGSHWWQVAQHGDNRARGLRADGSVENFLSADFIDPGRAVRDRSAMAGGGSTGGGALASFRSAAFAATTALSIGARVMRRALTSRSGVGAGAGDDGGQQRGADDVIGGRANARDNPVYEREGSAMAGQPTISALRMPNTMPRHAGHVLITDPMASNPALNTSSGDGLPVVAGSGTQPGSGVVFSAGAASRSRHLNSVTSGNARHFESTGTFKTLEEPGTARSRGPGAWAQIDIPGSSGAVNPRELRRNSGTWADAVFQEAMGEAMGGLAASNLMGGNSQARLMGGNSQARLMGGGVLGSFRGIVTSAANITSGLQRVGSQAHRLVTQTSGQMVFKAVRRSRARQIHLRTLVSSGAASFFPPASVSFHVPLTRAPHFSPPTFAPHSADSANRRRTS